MTNHGHAEHKTHVLPIWLLVGVWVALMGLTVLTVVAAKMHLGEIDFFISMLIATVKGSLVALVFMHLLWDKGFHSVLVVAGLLTLGLFLGATLFDRAHYQDSIEALERDYPPTRRFPANIGTGEHAEHGGGEGGGTEAPAEGH